MKNKLLPIQNLLLLILVFILTGCQPATSPPLAEDLNWGEIEFTQEEMEWLETHETIRIAYVEYPPFLITDGENFTGIAFDTLNILLDKIGLEPEYVNSNMGEALADAKNKAGADIISLIGSTAEREEYLEFTKDIVVFPNVIFSQKNAPFIGDISDLHGKTVAIENRFRVHDALKEDYPEINLLVVDTTQEALQAVSTSQADAYIGNLAVGSYMIQEYGLVNLKVAAPSPFADQNLAIGIRKDQQELASILKKTLAAMPEETLVKIRQNWLIVTYEYGISQKDMMVRIGSTVIVAVVILGLAVYANQRLEIEIAQTKKVKLELEESKTLLRLVLDSNPSAIFMVDEEGKYVFANQTTAKDFDTSVENLIGKTRSDFLQDLENASERIQRSKETDLKVITTQKTVLEQNVPFALRNGKTHWFDTVKTPVTLQDGRKCVLVLTHNVTQRRKAEKAVQESEKLLRHVLDANPSAIFLVDAEGKFVFANQEAAFHYGTTVDAMIDKTRFELLPSDEKTHAEEFARFHAEDLKVIETQEPLMLPTDYFTMPDGKLHWFETLKTPVTIQDGRECVLVISRDMTDRYAAEAALEESERLLRHVLDANPTAIFLIDEEGKFVLANQTTAEIFSTDLDQMIGKTRFAFSCQSEEKIQAFKQYEREDQEVIASQQPKLIEREKFSFPDGSERWFQTFKRPLTLQNGHKCVLVVALDITARREAEMALEESEKQLRAVIDATPDVILVKDREGNFLLVNETAASLYDMTVEEMQGLSEEELARLKGLSDELIEQYIESDRMVIDQQIPISIPEEPITHPGKSMRWFHTRKIPLESQGKTNKVLIVSTNITERKKALEALKQERASLAQRVEERTAELVRLNIELQESSRSKDEFLANMSHELRTPLNAILGMSEILQEQLFGDLNEKQLKHVGIIEQSGQHLLTLINDILDLAKIEAGESQLSYQGVNISDLCDSSLNFIKQQAMKKKLAISYDSDLKLGEVEGDPRSLKQILVNLLSNAVKFTPEGGRIGIEANRDEEKEIVSLTVWDNGIGITPQQSLKLFRPFVQIDSSLSRNYEGTGLGLALISRLVDMHGGSITLESTGVAGEGSRFTIHLPFQQAKVQTSIRSKFEDIRILLMDDDSNSALRIKTILNSMGCRVFISENKLETIRMVQTIQPDLIILDLQIPQETNIATIHQIRQEIKQESTPIFSMTSLMLQGSSLLSNSLGVDEHLLKPVSPGVLDEALKKHLQKR